MPPTNRNGFLLPFLSLFLLFLFCIIELARNSTTMLKQSGESGHPALLPRLQESSWYIARKYDVSCRVSVCAIYPVEEVPFIV